MEHEIDWKKANMVDTQLEGRLFDLLEQRAKLRLGDLNHLRRLSRSRRVTILDVAFAEGRVSDALGRAIADEMGIELRLEGSDAFYDQSDHTLSAFEDSSDSIVDGLPDALTRPPEHPQTRQSHGVPPAEVDGSDPVTATEQASNVLGPPLIRPPHVPGVPAPDLTVSPTLNESPKATETIDVSLSEMSLMSWEQSPSAMTPPPNDEVTVVDRMRQGALHAADEFLALPSGRSSEQTGVKLDTSFGTQLGRVSRAFNALLETGDCTAADRAALKNVLETARDRAEVAKDEAWIAYLDALTSSRVAEQIAGPVSETQVLDLEIDGPPAMIILYRFVESGGAQKRTRVKQFYETTGLTGTFEVGSYLAELTYVNGVIEYPFLLSATTPVRCQINIPSMGYDRARYAYLSSAEPTLGGDHLAWNSLARRRVAMKSVLFGRRPVSCRAYAEFLNHQLQRNPIESVMARAPREGPGADTLWPVENGAVRIPVRDKNGTPWDPSWPIVGISLHDALAFCHWLNQHHGSGHRLPTEDEWEWAVRGADGRSFPWGDRWSPHHCHTRKATSDVPTRRPPRNFAVDYSPFGIEALAGGVSEWTMSSIGADDERVVKGGHWSSGAIECRASSRFTASANDVRLTLGFRVVRDVR
ncbi:MAG: SUMF1/EgtB/PvdO family nonheme iron enzyme [Myxococcota bacterium]|nr:SUMF1/EgtB/PvdO family nonheme iron enzyme [Myxococcota bacterium]